MGGTIHFDGLGPDRDGFDPSMRSLSYMRLQLWRRGFRGRARLAEGLDLALHHVMIEVGVGPESMPTDMRDWRRILDRAVYRAMRELCSCGSAELDIDSLSGCLPADGGTEQADRVNSLSRAVAALPVSKRLLLYLKLADSYVPNWESRGIVWTAEERDYLLSKHPDRSIEEIMAEFRSRVAATDQRHQGKVPSAVIAWLMGRASADAVDTAYRELKQQLRNAAPPGAAAVSNARDLPTLPPGTMSGSRSYLFHRGSRSSDAVRRAA